MGLTAASLLLVTFSLELHHGLDKQEYSIWLYGDDGLGIVRAPAKEIEGIRKAICGVFMDNNLQITTEVNSHKFPE